MESISYFKNLKVTPKKLRMLLPQIKKMTPSQALISLYYSNNKPSKVFYKAIHSALTNAKHTLKVEEDLIQFKLLTIEEGQKLKRYRAGGRGTAKPFARKFAHIKIVLHSTAPEKKETKEEKKSEVKAETAVKKETKKREVKNKKEVTEKKA